MEPDSRPHDLDRRYSFSESPGKTEPYRKTNICGIHVMHSLETIKQISEMINRRARLQERVPAIHGEFNEMGYYVLLNGQQEIYVAGNCRADSAAVVDLDSTAALPLSVIKKHCVQTAKEIAKEKGAKYKGVEYVETKL